MKTYSPFKVAPWLLVLSIGCGSEDPTKPASSEGASQADASATAKGAVRASPEGSTSTAAGARAESADGAIKASDNDDTYEWNTDEFSVDVGQERYLCFAKTLDEDMVINGYSTTPKAFVHHLLFVRTRAPEPEGFAECDVAYRDTWDTVYASGAGANALDLPSDAGHKFGKGTQLLVQLHLLNAGVDPVKGTVSIRMRRSMVDNPRPVNTYVFGSAAVKLPAHQTSSVVGDCRMRESVELIAGLPHTHRLGQALHFEVGGADGNMKEVFKRDPFNFDDQHIDTLDVKLAANDTTRVTCTFTNTSENEVTYGESTTNEMCYFVAFSIDRAQAGACVASPPGRAMMKMQ